MGEAVATDQVRSVSEEIGRKGTNLDLAKGDIG
jgi:hypothetical protein